MNNRPPLLLAAMLATVGGCADYQSRLPVPLATAQQLSQIHSVEFPRASTQPATQPTTAPTPVRLSLADARERAIRHNLDLAVARFDPAIARADLNAEEAAFEAVFTTQLNYANLDRPTGSQLTSAQSTAWELVPGVRIPLRTGGEIDVSLPMSRNESDNRFNTLNPSWESDLTVSVRQPILRGAGFDVSEQGIRVAFYADQQAQARTKLEVIRVIAEVDRAYWRLEAARRILAVRVQQRNLAQQQLDRVIRQVNAGTVAETERVRSEAGLSDTIEAIILADTDARQRQRELKALMNDPALPVDQNTVIELSSPLSDVELEVDAPELVRRATTGRMELLDAELAIAAQTANVLAARNATLPLVSLQYTYGLNGLGPRFDDSLPTDLNYQDHRVGLQVEIPIGNEAARARLRSALNRRLQLLSTRDARVLSIRQEVLDAIDRLNRDSQRVQAARQRVILNERLLAAEQRQFDQQLRTSTEVLAAQANLADAQSSLVSAGGLPDQSDRHRLRLRPDARPGGCHTGTALIGPLICLHPTPPC
ncbi:MAG: TolC family protein [Tepidisphaeraceae bacterium]